MSGRRTGCFFCGTTDDVRPYGPGGSSVCFHCMRSSPDREESAGAAFGAILDATLAVSPTGVTIGDSDGLRPFDPREAS